MPTRTNGTRSRWLQHFWQTVASWRPGPADSAPSPASNQHHPLCSVTIEGDDEQAQLVQRFLDLGRSALLLRPAIAETISTPHLSVVREVLLQEMAWTAEGDVLLTCASSESDANHNGSAQLEHVLPFYLDRFPVTNRRYHEFVAQGGYRQESIWDATIWPRVNEFVDRTGNPGPRYWSDGTYAAGSGHCPVVGVSWFEADAFARWVGKRLPSDAEWVKVATCPAATTDSLLQRRFPWGDVWDPERSNLWISGLESPTPVDQFSQGASATGVLQMIGNVWEWTTSDLRATSFGEGLQFATPLKSLRGGAFDTYFENQASCQLQSGDAPLARRHNIGFRCALSATDIVGLEQQP